MSMGPVNRKDPKPCGNYGGNLCSGFGGKCICMWCGWDRMDHPNEFTVFPPKE